MTRIFRTALLLCALLSGKAFAQNAQPKPQEFAYFVVLSGIETKDQVAALEPVIQKKPGVTAFQSRQFPPKFFMLKSSQPLDESVVRAWMEASGLKLTEYLQSKPENQQQVADFLRRNGPQARAKKP